MQSTTTILSSVATSAPARVSWRSLLWPREHGSWSLALEPLGLAMIAAPSWPGAALGLSGLALFFARRPWQAARAGDVRLPQAAIALTSLGALAIGALAVGTHAAPGSVAWALLAAMLAGATFAWFDRRKQGRAVAAELSGSACFAALAAAIVLAADQQASFVLAGAVAGFVVTRSFTSILAIRAFLRRRKGESVSRWPAMVVGVVAIAAFVLYAPQSGGGLCRWMPVIWCGLFLARTMVLLLSGRAKRSWTARHVGMGEAVLGVLAMVTTGLALAP